MPLNMSNMSTITDQKKLKSDIRLQVMINFDTYSVLKTECIKSGNISVNLLAKMIILKEVKAIEEKRLRRLDRK